MRRHEDTRMAQDRMVEIGIWLTIKYVEPSRGHDPFLNCFVEGVKVDTAPATRVNDDYAPPHGGESRGVEKMPSPRVQWTMQADHIVVRDRLIKADVTKALLSEDLGICPR
jgi:hypothetical protein